jgi:hypothetical protein
MLQGEELANFLERAAISGMMPAASGIADGMFGDVTVQSLFQEDGVLGFLGLGGMFSSGSSGGGGIAGFGSATAAEINAEYLNNPNVTQEEIAAKYP